VEITVSIEELRENVGMVASVPRLQFTDQTISLLRSVRALAVDPTLDQGVYWGQHLTHLFERVRAEGRRYILAFDYDSIYTERQIVALYWMMEQNPDIDALCPLQMKRGRDEGIFTAESEDGRMIRIRDPREFDCDFVPIKTGHFGLTLLRAERLDRLDKPWFIPVPDRDGGYGPGKTDEDIRFWLLWRAAGNTFMLAPRVVIGHLNLMVTWPGRDLTPVHQYTSDYYKDGIPSGILNGVR